MTRPRTRTRRTAAPGQHRNDAERRILQRAVAELRAAFVMRGYAKPFPFFHCPNELVLPGATKEQRMRQATQREADGVEAGVPDLVIVSRPPSESGLTCVRIEPSGIYSIGGAAIELKAPGESPSPEQQRMLGHFAAIGFACRVFVGHRECANGLVDLGYIAPAQRDRWIAWAERADPGAL